MNDKPVTDALLRRFLIGKVSDQERQQIETMFVTGALSGDIVIAAEQHLIDDYLEDLLTAAERERFLTQYGDTSVRRRKLRIAKAISDWPIKSAELARTGSDGVSIWNRLLAFIRLKPVFVVPIVAASMVAIIVGSVWLNRKWEQQKAHLALEQDLSRLNAPKTLLDVPPSTPPFILAPGSVRSAEAEKHLTPQPGTEFVELQLVWTQNERYPFYQAKIQRFDSDESFTVQDLQRDNETNAIRLRLFTRMLSRGHYQIELSGVAPHGGTSPAEEYGFQVP